MLRSELRDLPSDRLRLRIVCRSADWPGDMEAALRSTWGEDGVGIFELVPLTKSDVAEAAKSWGIPPDKFLKAVAEVGAAPLANRPITLEFLVGAFSRGQSLLTNRTALYADGCKLLCEEPSESRRDSPKGHAMQTQLVDRYLTGGDCRHGIYVVGWFSGTRLMDARTPHPRFRWTKRRDSLDRKPPRCRTREFWCAQWS